MLCRGITEKNVNVCGEVKFALRGSMNHSRIRDMFRYSCIHIFHVFLCFLFSLFFLKFRCAVLCLVDRKRPYLSEIVIVFFSLYVFNWLNIHHCDFGNSVQQIFLHKSSTWHISNGMIGIGTWVHSMYSTCMCTLSKLVHLLAYVSNWFLQFPSPESAGYIA